MKAKHIRRVMLIAPSQLVDNLSLDRADRSKLANDINVLKDVIVASVPTGS